MNPIIAAMETVRKSQIADENKVEFALEDATPETTDLIKKNGGRIEGELYHKTCYSEPCAHNSHSEGYWITDVSVPAEWAAGCDRRGVDGLHRLFNTKNDDLVLFVIPDVESGPRAIVERYHGGAWGRSTQALYPKEHLRGTYERAVRAS